MKKVFFFIITCFFIAPSMSQDVFRNSKFQFQMQKPKNWIEADNEQIKENLENIEFTEEQLSDAITDHKGSLLLAAFYKYDPRTASGVIPTIQINVRNNATPDFESFKNLMIQSTEGIKNFFPDFKFIVRPKEVVISGIKGIYFIGSFTMKSQSGVEMKVRSRTYAIPYKNYFFQLNFTDSKEKEDCSKEFDTLVNTIKIGKN